MKAKILLLFALVLYSYNLSPEFSDYLDSTPDSEYISLIIHIKQGKYQTVAESTQMLLL